MKHFEPLLRAALSLAGIIKATITSVTATVGRGSLILLLTAAAIMPRTAIAASVPTSASERPNLIFILSDDATWQAISAYNPSLPVKTPNLDRLAASGLRFDRCTVGNSICSPSRATLLTGTHSHVNGVTDNYTPFDGRQVTYPKLLQTAGYQTALIGKWHLHTLPTGFDHYDIMDGQGRYFDAPFIRKGENKTYPAKGHTDVHVGDRALAWLRETRDPARPFALNVHFKMPHRPFMPPAAMLEVAKDVQFPEPPTLFDDFAGRSRAAHEATMRLATDFNHGDLKISLPDRPSGAEGDAWRAFQEKVEAQATRVPREGRERLQWVYQRYLQDYVRCMLALDEQVGRLLDGLDELGLAQSTVVFFAGDQGFYLGEHGWFDKRFMYEPSFRTPFLVRAPGLTTPDAHTSVLVQNIDWAPTILDLAGVPVPEEMQGRSLLPLLRGEVPEDWRTSVYYHYYEGPTGDHTVARHEGVATARHKLIHYYELDEWELFDLQTDPQETRNRIDDPAAAEQITELKAELQRLRAVYRVPANDTIPSARRRDIRTEGVERGTP